MHMRKKPWTEPALMGSGLFIEDPETRRGRWNEAFPRKQRMELEVGCGKCVSTARMALAHPDVNILAVDESRTILGMACRSIAAVFEGKKPENLRLTCFDVMRISEFIAPEDTFDTIYIQFCNPWTQKSRHFKRRLTHTRQLVQYLTFLSEDGEVRFKTDDTDLFQASLGYFEEAGMEIVYRTDDLHASGYTPNYVSEHEKMYSDQGIPIHFAIAGRKKQAP